VATDTHQESELAALKKRGEDNGVEGLRLIGADEIRKREPHIKGVAALDVPSTGIVSAEELVHAYARVATNQEANIVTFARVTSLEPSGEPYAWACASAMKRMRRTNNRGAVRHQCRRTLCR